MVVHWWRLRDAHWRRSLFFNATGGVLSAIVFITAGITKFTAGAWVAVLTVGLFMLVAMRIRHHYDLASKALALQAGAIEVPRHTLAPSAAEGAARDAAGAKGRETEARAETEAEETPEEIHHLMIVPVASLDRAGMRALAYVASFQQPVLALHLSPTKEEAERFRDYWRLWGDHLPLEVVVSPYRAIVAPMVNYIELLHRQHPTQSDRAATTACAPTPAQDRRHDHPVPPTELESARPEATRARRAQCPTSGNC